MKKIIIISLLFLSGCAPSDASKGLKIYKASSTSVDSLTEYKISGENISDNAFSFFDKTGKFSVGDTIMIEKKH